MRKQTKVVAVASAAALLAIGASMTSFAATGWVEEDGTWYFYDNDGNRVEDTWKKSGDNWYWLDSEEGGAMATEKIIEDDNDIYYVDANGVMVRNSWVKVVNEDQDEDNDPAEYHYYYMQSNGKAYKAPDSSATRFRTIDGKRYAFDTDGIMLYGWVNESSEREGDESDWATEDFVYYLGNWDDGAMKTGWQKLYVHDELEDDDMEHWFNFKSNGKKRTNTDADQEYDEVSINGRKYGFDNRGVMVSQWTLATDSNSASAASASSWKYFSSPEDGARVTKGWFKVVAPMDDNDNTFRSDYGQVTFASTDAEDESERWYYADGSGNIKVGEIYKIKGKYYGFRPDDDGEDKGGAMLSGLVLMVVDSNGRITRVLDDDVDSDELDALIDGDISVETVQKYNQYPNASLYYFGSDEDSDGAMKTGATTVTLDGETYHFYFSKTGGAEGRGRGLTGVDDDKYIYKLGCRVEADQDDKYQVVGVAANGAVDINADGVVVQKIESRLMRRWANMDPDEYDYSRHIINTDNESVVMVDMSMPENSVVRYYLVNTSGNIQKSGGSKKDGDDWYFYVKDRAVKLYANNKNLNIKGTDESEKWDTLKDGSTTEGIYVEYLTTGN